MLVSIEGLRTISGLTLHTLHGFAAWVCCIVFAGADPGGVDWVASHPLGCAVFFV